MRGSQAGFIFSKLSAPAVLLPFLFLCIAAASVAYFLMVAADRENENAAATSLHLAETALASVRRDTEDWARDYAWWDETLELAKGALDSEWAEDNIGQYLRETFGISGSLLLDPEGRTLFTSRDYESYPADAETLLGAQREAFFLSLQGSSMERSEPFTTFAKSGEKIFVAAAAPVTAEHPDHAGLQRHRRPILLLYKALDEDLMAMLASQFLLKNFSIQIKEPVIAPAMLPLRDFKGETLAFATWVPARPGDDLVSSLLPRIAVSAALLIIGAFLVFYFSWRSANAANRAKSDFLAKISHELRTPLNPIIGFSEVMTNEVFGPLPAKYKDYATDINRASRHLEVLIEDILDISRIEAGKLSLHETSFDICALLRDLPPLTELLPPSSRQSTDISNTVVRMELPESIPNLYADEFRVRQVVSNMLSNAAKHSGSREIVIGARFDGAEVQVFVEDFGIGISAADLRKLFNPFVQLSDAHIRSRPTGSGLGLALSRELMALHGGSLELESEPGKGTKAILRFPADRTAAIS